MKTADFIREHHACRRGAKWALSISDDMADVWDAMIKQNRYDWLLWAATQPGVLSDTAVRKLACRFARETPLLDGRKVWDLLTDERSRKAVEMAERYADGNATESELYAAHYAARAADAAHAAASDAAWAAACAAAVYFNFCATVAKYTVDAARAADAAADAAIAAYDAARAAQARMIAELGNPFREAAILTAARAALAKDLKLQGVANG